MICIKFYKLFVLKQFDFSTLWLTEKKKQYTRIHTPQKKNLIFVCEKKQNFVRLSEGRGLWFWVTSWIWTHNISKTFLRSN